MSDKVACEVRKRICKSFHTISSTKPENLTNKRQITGDIAASVPERVFFKAI
jgi:hypothetical protein